MHQWMGWIQRKIRMLNNRVKVKLIKVDQYFYWYLIIIGRYILESRSMMIVMMMTKFIVRSGLFLHAELKLRIGIDRTLVESSV